MVQIVPHEVSFNDPEHQLAQQRENTRTTRIPDAVRLVPPYSITPYNQPSRDSHLPYTTPLPLHHRPPLFPTLLFPPAPILPAPNLLTPPTSLSGVNLVIAHSEQGLPNCSTRALWKCLVPYNCKASVSTSLRSTQLEPWRIWGAARMVVGGMWNCCWTSSSVCWWC